jgi:hypothetical protein
MLMSPVDQSVLRTSVTELDSKSPPSLNHHIYLRLRLALSLNLRRQIFIAVCDDVALRDQFAAHLEADLQTDFSESDFNESDFGCSSSHRSTKNNFTIPPVMQGELTVEKPVGKNLSNGQANFSSPKLVNLPLDLENPDVLGQVGLWLSHNTTLRNGALEAGDDRVLGFQITGVEQLTRQPAHVQRAFLESLQALAAQLSTQNFNLLLWVTRPWCRSIQQSAPDFWQWHTALFEFAGDPAPMNGAGRRGDGAVSQAYRQNSLLEKKQVPATSQRESLIDSELRELVLTALKHDVALQSPSLNLNGLNLSEEAISELLDQHPSLQPIRLLQHLEKLHREQALPDTVGTAYRELGDWYRDRAQHPQAGQTDSAIALRAYEQALRLINPKSLQVPDVLNDIGNLYWLMARDSKEAKVNNLEKALKAYQFALERTGADTQPATYAMVLSNLAAAHSDLSQQQSPVEHLHHAIAAYQSCLQYRTAEEDASRYAATQNNLGTAFWNLAQHQQPGLNLQQAVTAYNEALRYYNPEHEPLHYAMLQNNLGTAYWTLAQCDEAMAALDAMAEDFLLLAIGAYRIALIYRTLEAAPTAYAATQNNLGTAYWNLANQPTTHSDDRQNYLQCAIYAYQEALSAVEYLSLIDTLPAPTLSFDVSATHHNLGLACYQVALPNGLDSTTRSDYLETALQHHVQALQGWQDKPDFYQAALSEIIQTVRTFHDRCGIQGQTLALSRIPAALLPLIMREL